MREERLKKINKTQEKLVKICTDFLLQLHDKSTNETLESHGLKIEDIDMVEFLKNNTLNIATNAVKEMTKGIKLLFKESVLPDEFEERINKMAKALCSSFEPEKLEVATNKNNLLVELKAIIQRTIPANIPTKDILHSKEAKSLGDDWVNRIYEHKSSGQNMAKLN